jgi:hypothetical protein
LLYKFSQNVLQKDMLRENTLELFCSSRAFGPCSRAFGPHSRCTLEVRSTEAYTSGMDYKSILIIWFCIEISRNEWDINFWGMYWLLQKMAAKYRFWEIGEREFLRDPKKYTFGKSNFKTFLKSRIFQILPPFLSTFNTWIELILLKMVSANGGPKKFF